MIEIGLNKINKNYGFNSVLKDLTFDIKTNERIALIGSNGCGKTTTLRIINGDEIPDTGNITIRKDRTIGYLSQIPKLENKSLIANDVFLRGIKNIKELEDKIKEFTLNMSDDLRSIEKLSKMQEEFQIMGGYEINSKVEKIKHGFNLTNELLNTTYNNLSGGEKTIVNLASLILSNPDILLLDEPTNHLDIETLEWLEEYLTTYNGTILIVSHDRYFLDKVVNKIICLDDFGKGIYNGNYSYYVKESEKRFLLQFQKYKNQQKEISAIEDAIKRLKEWGSKSDNPLFFRRAASMEKRLEKMEIIDKPREKKEIKINFDIENRSSNHILEINNLNLNIENKELLINSNMEIYYKQRVCLMGKNGAGKTTLIKNILNNTHDNIKLGTNIKIGYIPQEIRFENDNLTIYEYIRKSFVGSETELRSKLNQFYFSSESIDKKLKYISGGEKVRIKLLNLILQKSNFLILDEPTNHIDIETKEILEEALLKFDGTILFISHDRYFINKIATKIVRIENKKLVTYNCKYDEIKCTQIVNNEKINTQKEIKINGSNRLNEFLKNVTNIEEVETAKNIKIYKIRKKSKIFYLKIANHLSKESIKIDYLSDKLNIYKKIFYEKYNGISYMLLKDINGISLDNEYFINHKDEGIKIIVDSFNDIYNVDYSDCVFDETIDSKIKEIENNLSTVKEKDIDKSIMNKFHTKDNILKYLKGNKPKQIIGFTHGNMSLSNIIAYNNKYAGLINVIDAGISDIYFDLVSCEISIEKNYGNEYVDKFYNSLGIEKDEFKSEYYRILLSI